MKKFGEIPILARYLKVDGPEFGDAIVKIFEAKEESFKKHGHGVLFPYHGVLVAGPTLDDAYDLLERIEDNALALFTGAVWDLTKFGESADPLDTITISG
jgi:ribulose-5-phosphate 4-epimerase/fuculose-1-phosphate aldolase